jgi:hypothetical protein
VPVRRIAALCVAAAALLIARIGLVVAPGRTVRIAARVNPREPSSVENPREPRPVENPRDPRLVENPRDPRPVENPRDPRPVNSARIRDLCWAVTAISARSPLCATCLEQGVALVMLLTMARIPANLVVGVARAESAFRAHAWVECGGVVVLGGVQSHGFTPLLRVPASSRPSPFSLSCPG